MRNEENAGPAEGELVERPGTDAAPAETGAAVVEASTATALATDEQKSAIVDIVKTVSAATAEAVQKEGEKTLEEISERQKAIMAKAEDDAIFPDIDPDFSINRQGPFFYPLLRNQGIHKDYHSRPSWQWDGTHASDCLRARSLAEAVQALAEFVRFSEKECEKVLRKNWPKS